MALTEKEIKERYFDRVYAEANVIKCACGCGRDIKSKDRYGRDKMFVNGHNKRKYADPKQYKKEWRNRNRKTRYDKKIQRGHDLKRRVIKSLGGKCQRCGLAYDGKNACVFQCHHREPAQKLFQINTRTLTTYSWAKIKDEIEKTDLLCANCHYIIENEEY